MGSWDQWMVLLVVLGAGGYLWRRSRTGSSCGSCPGCATPKKSAEPEALPLIQIELGPQKDNAGAPRV